MNLDPLTQEHCAQSLDMEILIGSDRARDKRRKQFKFHIWLNEYRVYRGGNLIESGQALEELLETYNKL